MPNLIPDWLPWMRPAGRLIWSIALFVIGLIIIFVLMRRPKPERRATWAECIAGAVGVFAMMTLAYGVIPHEWITFSDKYLQWDTTQFVFRNNQDIFGLGIVNWPFNMDKHNVRDIIVVLIYGIAIGLNVGLSVMWQKRGQEQPETEEAPKTSRFGRPLRRRGAAPATAGASANGGDG
jgi:predicted membrane channel-forming protein YqfA (hemolysin III family)